MLVLIHLYALVIYVFYQPIQEHPFMICRCCCFLVFCLFVCLFDWVDLVVGFLFLSWNSTFDIFSKHMLTFLQFQEMLKDMQKLRANPGGTPGRFEKILSALNQIMADTGKEKVAKVLVECPQFSVPLFSTLLSREVSLVQKTSNYTPIHFILQKTTIPVEIVGTLLGLFLKSPLPWINVET